MNKLLDFAANKYSQNGEDGIIEKIFTIIPSSVHEKVCIEFGAWDGFHLSNTANLWANNNWKGILIEADKDKYINLIENVKEYNCICINEFVSYPIENTLEIILEKNNIKDEIDFLSIDIDGDDYYVFESLQTLLPKVICCEYNPTTPFHMSLIGCRGGGFGCSALALTNLAIQKGYHLVAITRCNCFYVKNEYMHYFSDYQTDIQVLQNDFLDNLNYIITDYYGRYVTNKENFGYGFTNPYKKQLFGDKTYKLKKSLFVRRIIAKLYELNILYMIGQKVKKIIKY